jgi:hypothetical protein
MMVSVEKVLQYFVEAANPLVGPVVRAGFGAKGKQRSIYWLERLLRVAGEEDVDSDRLDPFVEQVLE